MEDSTGDLMRHHHHHHHHHHHGEAATGQGGGGGGGGGGLQSTSLVHLDQEDMSSSSFSSASRASLELAQSSSGESLLPFHGDSSGSL
ncbi:hypothetical protein ZHAS_00009613 [Anopheles sinensis]|uniref:Uncharacterized protein n=1 Tax=Anopheles sinensis TaxID=74873 RepID=A0A084VVN8_ANOSI|nr:hypothetical protein ZHAS_00009613 [Anopheles sinensis]